MPQINDLYYFLLQRLLELLVTSNKSRGKPIEEDLNFQNQKSFMGKEKYPGYGLRIKQYLRTKGDTGLPSHAYVLCIFICTQRNDFRNETNSTHRETGSKHTSTGIPPIFKTTSPELLTGSHFPLKQQIFATNHTIINHTLTTLIPKLLCSVINNLLFQDNNTNYYKGIKKSPGNYQLELQKITNRIKIYNLRNKEALHNTLKNN